MSRVQRRSASEKPANRRTILYATIALAIVAVIVAAGFSSRFIPPAFTQAVGNASIAVGQKAPEFAVSTTQGPFDLATTTKPVFLEVFATWCPHCQREATVLNALYGRFGKDVAFVAVNGDAKAIDGQTPESQEDVVAFGEHFGVKYPLAYDPDLAVAKSYLKNGFPTMVVIDRQKKIAAIYEAEIDEDTLAAKLRKLL